MDVFLAMVQFASPNSWASSCISCVARSSWARISFGNVGRLGQVVAAADAVVLEPGDIEGIIALGNLLAGKAAETAGFALVLTLGFAVRVITIRRR